MVFKLILLSFILNLLILSPAQGVILTWDDEAQGTGLHVAYSAERFQVRDVRLDDLDFYQRIMANPDILKSVGSGQSSPKERVQARVDDWVGRFQKGLPLGRLTVCQDERPIGFGHVFGHEKPGYGEIVRVLDSSVQGQGLGTGLLGFLVKDWAPALRNRGLGRDIDPNHPSVDKFKCFNGEALRVLYTTSRPSNPASWRAYKHFDFAPSPSDNQEVQLTAEGWEQSQDGELEAYMTQKYFSELSSVRYASDTLYPMLDENGDPRTLSFKSEYGSLRYHYERPVEKP